MATPSYSKTKLPLERLIRRSCAGFVRPVLAFLPLALLLTVSPVHSQSIWITGFNSDSSQPPQGYRHDVNMRGQDIEVDFNYDIAGVYQVDVFINGQAAGFSCYLGAGYCYGTLAQTCGKQSVKVRAFTVLHTYDSSSVDVFAFNSPSCLPRPTGCELGSNAGATARPCNVVSGRLWYQATDIQLSGPFGLRFSRMYDNQSGFSGDLGAGWRHDYGAQLLFETGQVVFVDQESRRTYFNGLGAGGSVHDMLNGSDLALSPDGQTYTLTTWGGMKYRFDNAGRLTQLEDRVGNQQAITRDGSNRIQTVEDPLGRTLTFGYDGSNRITSVTSSPTGVNLSFTYDTPCGSGNLCSATMPDAKQWTYGYDGSHNLTSVVDPLGHAEETNTFSGGKLATQTTEGGQNSLTFTYGATSTTVTDGLSRQTVYTFDPNLRVVTDVVGVGCGCGGGEERSFGYDQFLRKQWEMIGNDPNHTVTWAYGRDQTVDHGGFTEVIAAYPSPTSKTEPLSSGVDRTTSWTYYGVSDPRRDLVQVETLPSVDTSGNTRTTTYNYATNGLLDSRVDQGYVDGVSNSYTTSYTYDGKGRAVTVDGPRTDGASTGKGNAGALPFSH